MKLNLTILLLITALNVHSQNFSGGSGTESDPFKIGTVADLITLSQLDSAVAADYWNKFYILTENIDFGEDETLVDWNGNGTADWNSEDSLGFKPIGFFDNGMASHETRFEVKFRGHFIGNCKSISNLYINRPLEKMVGLWGYLYYGSVKYLKLENVNITGKENVGGLIGKLDGSKVFSCSVSGEVNGQTMVGGLIGNSYFNFVDKCQSNGNVAGVYNVGGLMGMQYHAGLRCRESFSTSNVTGEEFVGGLIGQNLYGKTLSCYATGNVTGDNNKDSLDGYFVGGLIGLHGPKLPVQGEVVDCYSTGKIASTHIDSVGGLVGWNDSSIISNSYFDKETTSLDKGVGKDFGTSEVHAKTSADMKKKATFSNWDFVKTWNIVEDVSYPKHSWQYDATLSMIYVNGKIQYQFGQDTLEYTIGVPLETLPILTAYPNDLNATVLVTQTSAVPGKATIVSTSADGQTSLTYTINFVEGISSIESTSAEKQSKILVYPNPVHGNEFTLSLPQAFENKPCTVQIVNSNGQIIWSDSYITIQKENRFNTESFATGIYWIEVISKDSKTSRTKFMVL